METRVGLQEAKTNFQRLIHRAENGEEITLLRRGTPVARLVPLPVLAPAQRPLGLMRDEWELPPADELLRLFGCNA
jgi:prevent-host-death family protein